MVLTFDYYWHNFPDHFKLWWTQLKTNLTPFFWNQKTSHCTYQGFRARASIYPLCPNLMANKILLPCHALCPKGQKLCTFSFRTDFWALSLWKVTVIMPHTRLFLCYCGTQISARVRSFIPWKSKRMSGLHSWTKNLLRQYSVLKTHSYVHVPKKKTCKYENDRPCHVSGSSWRRRQQCRRGETRSLNCSHQWAYSSSPRWYMNMKNCGEMILTGGNS
jgi:hypothetical protein